MSDEVEVEVAVGGETVRRRHRRWSEEEKRRIVAETFEPGASVSVVARRHDVNANQVFGWRRQFGSETARADEAAAFMPVVVSAEPLHARSRPDDDGREVADGTGAASPASRMKIVLSGGRRVIVDKTVNAAALARVLGVLGRA